MVEMMNGHPIESVILKADHWEDVEGLPEQLQPIDKLKMALQMAEAIAHLHGHEEGPVAHSDIQYGQFLLDYKNNVYLSDFNRAEPLLWDMQNGSYCMHYLGAGGGTVSFCQTPHHFASINMHHPLISLVNHISYLYKVRSPEEYMMNAVNESIDVYSFGMILYTLLSGTDPYDEYKNDTSIHEASVNGIIPIVDEDIISNSFAEAILTYVMGRCLDYKPEERIDIFEVVSILRKASDDAEVQDKNVGA